jgi:predicted nucleotidyltransferase
MVVMKPSEALAAHRDELRELVSHYGLTRPRVYGSALSRTDSEESDLDLLVDATENTTLFPLVRLERAAQELLGVRVSVLTAGFLPEKFRDRVLAQSEPL